MLDVMVLGAMVARIGDSGPPNRAAASASTSSCRELAGRWLLAVAGDEQFPAEDGDLYLRSLPWAATVVVVLTRFRSTAQREVDKQPGCRRRTGPSGSGQGWSTTLAVVSAGEMRVNAFPARI